MDLEYIREFVTLAETKNFAETAERLFTTQSTISKHLKKLEEELGAELFTRTSRQVYLNKYGMAFLPFAKEFLKTENACTSAFYELLHTSKELSVGSIPMMASYGITDAMMRFEKANPAIRVNVLEADTSDLIHCLKEGKCEIAFLRDIDHLESGFVSLTFAKDSLAAMLPKTHPLAAQESLSLTALADEKFVLLKEKTYLYDLCFDSCKKAGFSPNVVYTSHHFENLVSFVKKDKAVSLVMSGSIPETAGSSVSIVPLQPPVTNRIVLAYVKGRKLSPEAALFLRCLPNK